MLRQLQRPIQSQLFASAAARWVLLGSGLLSASTAGSYACKIQMERTIGITVLSKAGEKLH